MNALYVDEVSQSAYGFILMPVSKNICEGILKLSGMDWRRRPSQRSHDEL